MKSLALLGALLAVTGISTSEFSLKAFSDSTTSKVEVTKLKFGAVDRRRAAGEEITVTLSTGKDIVVGLRRSEELQRFGTCGSFSTDNLDVMVTGCEGNDRSITIGGYGTWDYDASTATFRRLEDEDVMDKCSSKTPPMQDQDAMMMNAVMEELDLNGEPVTSQLSETSQFKMEVRYYYDESLLEKYDGDHKKAQSVVLEMHEHTKVMMRHPSLGRTVHMLLQVDPTFIDLSLHAGPSNALERFMGWLDERDLCDRSIAFHHLITNRRSDGVAGVAWVGTVCHSSCYNTGITELWGSAAGAAQTMAHEFGHNLGALHTFSAANKGRDCHGIMSYGRRPDTWSACSRERWLADYDIFVKATTQERADRCFRPTENVPVPSPTPKPVQPTPKPVQTTTPPLPTGGVQVYIGRSSSNTRVRSLSESGLKCPSIVTKANWLGGYKFDDRFSVSVSGRVITVKRLDSTGGWSMPLMIMCTKESTTTPAPPAPTPAPPAPTPGGCKCSGKRNSRGQGGSDCSSRDSRGSWCYTALDACSDGRLSSLVSGQEWSYKACAGVTTPAPPVPSPTTAAPASTTTAPAPTSRPPSTNGSYKQMPGSGWCMTSSGFYDTARYTMPYPTTLAKTKAACDADSKCVAYVWGEDRRVGMIYSSASGKCKADCGNTSWQDDRSLITKAGWDGQRTWWKDCTCNVKQN